MKKTLETKLAGVSMGRCQEHIRLCHNGDPLTLQREPNNTYDINAIQVYKDDMFLGYINRGLATKLAPFIDDGGITNAAIHTITGGGPDMYYGVNILIHLYGSNIPEFECIGDEYRLFDMVSIIAAVIEDMETYHR